jgi:hypothetical protein
LLVDAVGQLDGEMQPGGDAADGGLWERFGERLDERVAAAAVAGSHAAQMAVQLAAGQEVGERVLFDPSAAAVGEELLVDDGLKEGGRDDQPADAKRRRKGLARRPGVDDPVGVEALERSDGGVLPLAGAAIAPTEATNYAMVDDATPAATMTEAFAWLATAMAVGGAVGAASAGLLVDRAGPTAGFALAGGAGALAVLATLLRSRTLTPRQAPIITLIDTNIGEQLAHHRAA